MEALLLRDDETTSAKTSEVLKEFGTSLIQ